MINPSDIFTISTKEDRNNAISLFIDMSISGAMIGTNNFVTCILKEDNYVYIKKYTFTGIEYIMQFGIVIPVDQWYKENGVLSVFTEYIKGEDESSKNPYLTKDGKWSTGEESELDPTKLI